MNKSIGFGAIGVILTIITVGVLGFITWRVVDSSSRTHNQELVDRRDAHQKINATPSSYKEYVDKLDRFSFTHPESWEVKQNPDAHSIISLLSPTLKEKVTKGFGGPNAPYFYDGAQFSLVVSRWVSADDIVKAEEYAGKRSYANLSDLLKDASSPKRLLNDITVNGTSGYEVINPGLESQYALLFERPDAIYQFEFSDVPNKESLSTEDKKIIETIKFN